MNRKVLLVIILLLIFGAILFGAMYYDKFLGFAPLKDWIAKDYSDKVEEDDPNVEENIFTDDIEDEETKGEDEVMENTQSSQESSSTNSSASSSASSSAQSSQIQPEEGLDEIPTTKEATYEDWLKMTGRQQREFSKSFKDEDAFFNWLEKAKKKYEKENPDQIIDGTIDLTPPEQQ